MVSQAAATISVKERDGFSFKFLRAQHRQQEQRQKRGGEQLSTGAAPIHDDDVVGVGGVQGGGKDGVRSRQIRARQQEHRDPGERKRDPLISAGHDFPGQERSQCRSQHPRCRRIEDEACLAVSKVGQGGPARVEDAKPPLAEDFHPGVKVKFEVVAGRDPEKEGGQEHGERRRHDDQDWGARKRTAQCAFR